MSKKAIYCLVVALYHILDIQKVEAIKNLKCYSKLKAQI